MAGRTLVALLALTGVVSIPAGCAQEGDASAEGSREAPSVRTEEARGEAPAREEAAVPADLAVAEFAVDGMTCGGCAIATEMAVKKLDGVVSADAEYDGSTGEGRCTVRYDPRRVGPERMIAAIREAGFRPRRREGGSD